MQNRLRMAGYLLGLLILLGCNEQQKTNLAKNSTYSTGIDVSHYQGVIDWTQVANSGIEFVFIKATEGENTVDPKFEVNWQESKQTNLRRGVYHYLDPSIDAAKQARHFLATTNSDFGELPPVVDIEAFEKQTAEEVVASLSVFLNMISKASTCSPIIYSSYDFLNSLKSDKFGHHLLWIADYNTSPKIPFGWKNWMFWQFKSKGKITGISVDVDMSYFSKDIATLEALSCKKN